MAKVNFEEVRLVFGESNRQIRQGVRTALYHEGFRNVLDTDKFELIEDAVKDGRVDLLVCDTEIGDNAIADLCYKVRHHEIGKNPFLHVLTVTGDPNPDIVRSVINSGSDDLILKPIAPGTLLKRIIMQAKARKGFVVTTDYIGPDRRKDTRPGEGQEIEVVNVPNVLKVKALGQGSMEDVQRAIDQAASVINEQKMERHAFQIGYLVERIVPNYVMGMADESVIPQLDRLQYVSEDITRRLEGTNYDHVSDLCESLVSLVGNIRKDPLMPSPKDVKLLPKMAAAINKAFSVDDRSIEVARDISQSVKSRRA